MQFKENLIIIIWCLLDIVVVITTLPVNNSTKDYEIVYAADLRNQSEKYPIVPDSTDAVGSSTTHQLTTTRFPTTPTAPGFQMPLKEMPSTPQEPLTPAAQNYFSSYYRPSLSSLGLSRPFYQTTEEPFLSKFLSQPHHHKQFLQQSRQQTFNNYDSSILGSGDFGVLRGGTFYSGEDPDYHQDDNSDVYYSEASSGHSGPATEGFIHKYTYPEEQFAQFRDFADLNTPSDTSYSQYVVVYAAKNSTNSVLDSKVPNNIFEQLQQIDEEKAAEERKNKNKNNGQGLSPTKLKLVKTKIVKKKWDKKTSKATTEEDPLLALS